MHWYPHDIKAFGFAARNLDFRERGIYRELLDLYYETERPLSRDINKVFEAIGASSDQDQNTARKLLTMFFSRAEDGWHQERADEVLGRYHVSGAIAPERYRNAETQIAAAQRQSRFRLKRAAMLKALAAHGKAVDPRTGNPALAKACEELGIDVETLENGANAVSTVTSRVTSHNVTVTSPLRGELQSYKSGTSGIPSVPAQLDNVVVGAALRVLRVAGLPANGSDPTLLALLAWGATSDELRLVGSEAVAKGKGVAWMAATIKGRRADAARPIQSFRDRADEEHLRRWAPELLKTKEQP